MANFAAKAFNAEAQTSFLSDRSELEHALERPLNFRRGRVLTPPGPVVRDQDVEQADHVADEVAVAAEHDGQRGDSLASGHLGDCEQVTRRGYGPMCAYRLWRIRRDTEHGQSFSPISTEYWDICKDEWGRLPLGTLRSRCEADSANSKAQAKLVRQREKQDAKLRRQRAREHHAPDGELQEAECAFLQYCALQCCVAIGFAREPSRR